MKINIKEMYGLNGKDGFDFNSEEKHNFIYGINASGKSSVATSINHFVTRQSYKKRFPYDSDDYYISINFDDIDTFIDKEHNDIENIRDLSKKVFVFNKYFIKNNLLLNDDSGAKPEIGIQIVEKNKAVMERITLVEDSLDKVISSSKDHKLPTSSKDFYSNSKLRDLGAKNEEKKISTIKYIASLEIKNEKVISDLDSIDFFSKNIELFTRFSLLLKSLKSDIIDEINNKKNKFKYKVKDTTDQFFYSQVVEYLKKNNQITNCPVCLTEDININEVIVEIEQTLKILKDNETLKNIENISFDLGNNVSLFSKKINNIYSELVKGNFPNDFIIEYENLLKKFLDNYDENYIDFINVTIEQNVVDEIDKRTSIIVAINKKNSELQKNEFIDEFDKMLTLIFNDDFIRAKSKLEKESIVIQLYISGKEKEEKSIEELFDTILSESQKTKLSLAFFISLITYKDINKKILCIFDDPIDSYDSISKYHISRIIYEFIHKKNYFENYKYDCYDIVLSHSIEYFRLFMLNFRKEDRLNNKYCILSKNLHDIKVTDLFLIEGDYNILNEILHKRFKRNENITIIELIGIIPILRELSKFSDNNFKIAQDTLKIGQNDIKLLNDLLSTKVLHGLDENIELNELNIELKKYISYNIDCLHYKDNIKIFDLMKDYILDSRNKQLAFYDEILLKNIIAMYVRNYYDEKLINILVNEVFTQKTKDDIKNNNDFWTLNDKISAIYKKTSIWNNYKNFCYEIASSLTMLNDYAHSAGIYLTPLIDVNIKDLYKLFDKINK